MSNLTPINAIQTPVLGDVPDIETSFGPAFTTIDHRLVSQFTSPTDRDARVASPVAGQCGYCTSTGELYIYNGTTWIGMMPRTKIQAADQQVTDNAVTLIDSTNLQFSVEANSKYKVYGSLSWFNSTFANDIRFGFSAPAGTAGSWSVAHPQPDDTFTIQDAAGFTASHGYAGNSGAIQRGWMHGNLVVGSTAGTCKLQFCEYVNSAGTSWVKLLAYSELSFLKIG